MESVRLIQLIFLIRSQELEPFFVPHIQQIIKSLKYP